MKLRAVALAVGVLAILPTLSPAAFAPGGEGDVRLSRSVLPPPETSALVVAEPSLGFTDEEAVALYGWVFRGGNLLIVDDSVVGVDLTVRMGIPVELVPARLYSPVFDQTPDRIPLMDLGTIPGLPSGITTSRPLLIIGGHDAVLVPTLTWSDRNDNGRPDLDEVLAQGSILSVVDIGSGIIVILSDPSLYLREDAREALHAFITDGGRELVMDGSHGTRVDPFATNVVLTGSPPRAATIALILAATLLVFFIVARPALQRVAPRRAPPARDELVRQALTELD